jgi:acetylornithine deacetylase/succinyl-diaminopimelate desuccinylase-like protein
MARRGRSVGFRSVADAQVYIDELAGLLAIPSVSADPQHTADVKRAGEWVCDYVRRAGGTCELVDWHGQPLAIGEIRASENADSAPTVIVYGHFDVQPADPLQLWESEPFVPTVRDGQLYARGIADDKGQLYMLLRAAADLAGEGALPVNIRICCDGEEETGGHSIVEFLEADERGADVCVIFDSGYQERDKPAFNLATRGLIYFHLTVRSGLRDLHSGMYGGAALNAVHALIETLQPLLSRGRLPEPLRQGIAPVTDEERAGWSVLRSGADELTEAGARELDAAAAEEFYVRTWSEPSLEINGIAGGSPILQKTVLPVEAEANVSIRLAPGQDVETIASAFEQLVRAHLPGGAELEIERWSSSPPGLVPPDSKAIQLGLDAFERTLGVRPLLVRSGGTLPIVPALAAKGIPAIITGFSLPDSNIHSPNERIPVEHLPLGVAAARELFLAFRDL